MSFPNAQATTYNDRVVRQFAIMTVVWGVVGMLVGVFIAAEASLSFLGIGLQPPTVSWGIMINAVGTATMQNSPHLLLFPALFLSITVLAFIMLGDAVRDAFDPKSH